MKKKKLNKINIFFYNKPIIDLLFNKNYDNIQLIFLLLIKFLNYN